MAETLSPEDVARTPEQIASASADEFAQHEMSTPRFSSTRPYFERMIATIIRSEREAAERRKTLFVAEPFKLHSGEASAWKIECDALTDADWCGLAVMAIEAVPRFSAVVGVERGGAPFASALRPFVDDGKAFPRLIVDDVLTTGRSMIEAMTRWDDIGLVVFARGPLPPRVTALFSMSAAVDRRVREAEDAAYQRAAQIAVESAESERDNHEWAAGARAALYGLSEKIRSIPKRTGP